MDEGRHVLVRLLPGALLQDPGGHQVRRRKLPGASVMKKKLFSCVVDAKEKHSEAVFFVVCDPSMNEL